jgi:hypothetical protein
MSAHASTGFAVRAAVRRPRPALGGLAKVGFAPITRRSQRDLDRLGVTFSVGHKFVRSFDGLARELRCARLASFPSL